MNKQEFRKLIREEIRKVLKEAAGLNYMVFSIYPKQLLQALAKYVNKQDVQITDGGGNFHQGNKKIYTITFTADSSVKKALDNLKKATDNTSKELIHHYEVKQAGASLDNTTNDSSSNVESYFSQYGVKLTNFDLNKFAKEAQLKKKQAEVALVNLENTKVMKDIAKGNYSTFDIYNPSLFNDEYEQMMDRLGLDWA